MGTITDKYADLANLLRVEGQRAGPLSAKGAPVPLIDYFLRPLLPLAIRCGPGTIIDVKDREVGAFDAVGCADAWPPVGHGSATTYLLDGVVFTLQMRDWSASDITQYGQMAQQLKSLERATSRPVFCGAISLAPLSLREIQDFLSGPSGQAVDGILVVGSHVVIRNSQGLYGDPSRVPFVTERGEGESLKAFAAALSQVSLSFLGQPFGWAAYQHL